MINFLYLLFVCSGAAGLMYESVWTRYLGLFVGHSAYAQVLVLVIFLGGMALGALAVGRRSSRLRDPLVGYAVIEVLTGLAGLAFHDIYIAVTDLAYGRIFPALGDTAFLLPAKWAIAGALILPQSILLGATFPLMSAGLLRRVREESGRRLAMLYFANSFGAAIGVLIAGFYLLGLVGLPGTVLAASLINVPVGIIAFVVTKRWPCPPLVETAEVAAPPPLPARARDRVPALLLSVSFGTAVASFLYEIGWIRMLSLVLGSATHSFELMLSAFILGLALGSYWIHSKIDRFRSPLLTLGLLQWMMGAAALATLPLYGASFGWLAGLMHTFAPTDGGYVGFTVTRYVLCLAVMLPATFCAGMTLPLITRTLLAGRSGEQAIGAVYGVNTLGSIVGAAIAGLVLLPWIGMKGVLLAGAAVDMALGAWLLLAVARAEPRRRPLALALGAAMLLALVAASMVRFDQHLLASGVYRTGRIPQVDASQMLFYRDGRTATVTAKRQLPGRLVTLSTNGKPDASLPATWFERCDTAAPRQPFVGDAATQLLAPLVTMAHAPHARAAAVIGQGSGMSSHFLLASPQLERLTTIEIEPAMVEGSKVFLPANRRVFDDPRSDIVIDDAKSYFAASGRRFDLIFSEPSNPWVSGVAGLFTAEFYARVAAYLTPDGVFGQWLHLYEIDDGLVSSVLAAMHQTFPSYEIFATSSGDLLIVAGKRPSLPAPDWSVLALPAVRRDVCRFVPFTPPMLEGLRLTNRTALAPLLNAAGSGNSDFYPVLDLGAEKTRYLRRTATGFGGLFAANFDFTAPFAGRRIFPVDQSVAPIPDLPRLRSLALSAALRHGARPRPDTMLPDGGIPDGTIPDVTYRHREWSALLLGGFPPPPLWRQWFQRFEQTDRDIHGGTAGVVDEAFYAEAFRFLDRHGAPAELRDAVTFWHGLRAWDFAEAAGAADRLLPAVPGQPSWLDPDEFRDGAVVAKLRVGDAVGARRIFTALMPVVRREPGDLRVRLLDAYVRAAEPTTAVALDPSREGR